MSKYLLHVLIISFIFLFTPIIHAMEEKQEEEKDRLLVVPLKAQKGIDQEEAVLLTDILSVEIHRSGRFTILNRDDMKAILNEKEFELAMGCEDNVCLLENVEKLAVNKIITGNIGKLGTKYVVSIRMINEDGENEVMERESCDCAVSELDKTIEQISYKFLKYLDGDVVQDSSIGVESEPKEDKGRPVEIKAEWSEWQDKMKSAYNEALRRDKDARLPIREKVKSWKRIIGNFRKDNPYSTEDNRIRRHAKIRLEEFRRLAGKPGRRPILPNDKRKLPPHIDRPIAKHPYSKTPHITLRSSYRDLSASQVHSMSNMSIRRKKDWGFDGHSLISHIYDLKSINGDKVVIDYATGLMWHQSGSLKHMEWNKAKVWIRSLNNRGYAGYYDWRLPTVEEAASLMESSLSDLLIDPVFSSDQWGIWTGDYRGSGAVWCVSYYIGRVYWREPSAYDPFYVRPVRSMSNMDSQHIKDNKEEWAKLSETVFTSNGSNVFHKRDCSKLDTKDDLVEFDSPQEASKAGGLPCNYCLATDKHR